MPTHRSSIELFRFVSVLPLCRINGGHSTATGSLSTGLQVVTWRLSGAIMDHARRNCRSGFALSLMEGCRRSDHIEMPNYRNLRTFPHFGWHRGRCIDTPAVPIPILACWHESITADRNYIHSVATYHRFGLPTQHFSKCHENAGTARFEFWLTSIVQMNVVSSAK